MFQTYQSKRTAARAHQARYTVPVHAKDRSLDDQFIEVVATIKWQFGNEPLIYSGRKLLNSLTKNCPELLMKGWRGRQRESSYRKYGET